MWETKVGNPFKEIVMFARVGSVLFFEPFFFVYFLYVKSDLKSLMLGSVC